MSGGVYLEISIDLDRGFSVGKESACNAGDMSRSLGEGRSPGGGHGDLLQCSCLENPINRGAWRTIVHVITELDTTEHHHHIGLDIVTDS